VLRKILCSLGASALLAMLGIVIGWGQVGGGLSWGQEVDLAEVAKKTEKKVFRRSNGFELPYRLLIPENYDPARKYPLIVFFHGAGERGTDNEAQLRHPQVLRLALDEKDPCFLVAPQCPRNSSWTDLLATFRQGLKELPPITEPMLATIELLEALSREYSLDRDRWYVTGLSMGGFGTFDLLIRKPDWFAAGVPLCGGMPEAEAPKIAHIPMWIFHGAADKVVPAELSRRAVRALEAAGASNVRYTEYEAVGHDVWRRAYLEPELRTWLLAQKRGPK
jgi:predicted peptidase